MKQDTIESGNETNHHNSSISSSQVEGKDKKQLSSTLETPIVVTDSALTKIKELMGKEPNADKLLLRFQAQPGGCSGYQYGLGFDETATAEDQCFTIQGIKIAIDKQSLPHLKGTHLDYVDGLQGSGFKFTNPNAKSTCGCGKSFC